MQYNGSDRREFFRINDTIVIDYRKVEKEQIQQLIEQISNPSINDTDDGRAQLRVLQSSFAHLIDQINQQDRNIAKALRVLDDKINLLAQDLNRKYHPIDPDTLIEANISGGGIAFKIPHSFEHKDVIELHIQLLPSADIIHALATVVSCGKESNSLDMDKPYNLRLVFTHMTEQDRNMLVRHTLNRQAEMLRNGIIN